MSAGALRRLDDASGRGEDLFLAASHGVIATLVIAAVFLPLRAQRPADVDRGDDRSSLHLDAVRGARERLPEPHAHPHRRAPPRAAAERACAVRGDRGRGDACDTSRSRLVRHRAEHRARRHRDADDADLGRLGRQRRAGRRRARLPARRAAHDRQRPCRDPVARRSRRQPRGKHRLTLLLLTFVGPLLIGTPIAIAMIASSALVIWTEGIPLTIVAQRVFAGLQSFPLLAVPLFTLAGSLMNESGISERLFGFTKALVGHIRGGLAQTAIVGNVFLSGISGSSVADCAATTRVLVPQLVASGYSRGFGAALAASAGTLGPIIPPSILMVLYAWQANVSLGALFVAGLLPGLVMDA